MPDPTRHSPAIPERLALRPREAAALLGISERTLWTLTKRGDVPHVRAGRAVLYPMDALRTWLTKRASTPTTGAEGGGR